MGCLERWREAFGHGLTRSRSEWVTALGSALTAGDAVGLPRAQQEPALLRELLRQLRTRVLLHPKLKQTPEKAFVTPPHSKTRKLKQSASFMHLKKQRKSELKTGWCLCLHVSA